jgi:hypothetical protein
VAAHHDLATARRFVAIRWPAGSNPTIRNSQRLPFVRMSLPAGTVGSTAKVVSTQGFEKRARRAGELLDLSFRLTWRTKTQWIPLLALYGLLYGLSFAVNGPGRGFIGLLQGFVFLVLVSSLLEIFRNRYDGLKIGTIVALKVGVRRSLHLFLYAIIALILLVVFSLALGLFARIFNAVIPRVTAIRVVLGIVFGVASVIASSMVFAVVSIGMPILVTERRNAFSAVKRTFSLVRGRLRPISGLFFLYAAFLFILYVVVIASVVGSVFRSIGNSSEISSASVVAPVLISGVLFLLSYPVFLAMTVVSHVDLLVRKEGLDLAELAKGLGPDPTTVRP